ncbi:TetR/AcrR family transcriptional regulator [Phenylobacterium sp.]|jgi:AcrR family transcriptional regulator|uniref:TetR/AcrR family transcriptional regulator n=1 Tax=Phenylobacterium sp. TaxID=1871053 RepID=UPI002F942A25
MAGGTAKVGSSTVDGKDAPAKKSARDRIFETACELFYARGIRAVGVETIASEAGATKMTLYRNFPSKDELVAECLRDQARQAWSWWDEVVGAHAGDPRRQLEALFEAFGQKTCGDTRGCALSNAAIELHEPDHVARAVAVEHKAETRRRLGALCKAAGARDEALADALFLMLEGAYVARVTLGESGPVRSLSAGARALMDCMLA